MRRYFVPPFIAEKYLNNQFSGEFPATALFVDVVGFTVMTQALMKNGKEGAEVLAGVINRTFAPAVDLVLNNGGFVASFAGDAFLALFSSSSVPTVSALQAALDLRALSLELTEQQTKFGTFTLSVRIGVSYGSVFWAILAERPRSYYYFRGDATRRAIENAVGARTGEVVMDAAVVSMLNGNDPSVTYEREPGGLYRLLSVSAHKHAVIPINTPVEAAELQNLFVSDEVSALTVKGEFRDVVSCFVMFRKEGDYEKGVSRAIELARRFGGFFNKADFSGREGSMLVLFGAPINLGNLFENATNFALALRDVPELTVRVGLACGTAFAGFMGSRNFCEYTALGSVVNLSARFAGSGKASGIYLDEGIYREIGSQYDVRVEKPEIFKGFDHEISFYSLYGGKKVSGLISHVGKMVGRDLELERLKRIVSPLEEGRFGGVVYIYGKPGIGKSRLAHEFLKNCGIRVMKMWADNLSGNPLRPFFSFFSRYFKQESADSVETKRIRFREIYSALTARLESLPTSAIPAEERQVLLSELNRVESVIAAVTGLFEQGSNYDLIAPQDRAVVIQQAVKQFFRALSLTEPFILLVEDIQWLEGAAKKVFRTVCKNADDFPFAVVACGRLNDDGSRPLLTDEELQPVTEINLSELYPAATALLAEEIFKGEVGRNLAGYIYSRAMGNPFYTVQFCLFLLENSYLQIQNGECFLTGEPDEIPADIHMLMVSRFDRLPANLREIVQIASVLGIEFDIPVLNMLVVLIRSARVKEIESSLLPKDLILSVKKLERENIFSRTTDTRYAFDQKLLHDAAYDMQLRSRLRVLHRLAGDAIVALNPGNKAAWPECAVHYELAEDWRRALKYCTGAGEYFENSVIYNEAIFFFRKALNISQRILGENHSETASAYNRMGVLFQERAEYDRALKYHEKALTIRLDLHGQNSVEAAESYSNTGKTYLRKGLYDMALEYHMKALAVREKLLGEKHVKTAESLSNTGEVYWKKGNYHSALLYHNRALDVREKTLGLKNRHTATSYNNLGLVYSEMGEYDRALSFYRRALDIQTDIFGAMHPDTAASLCNIGTIFWKKRDYNTALEYYGKALAVQEELFGKNHLVTAVTYNNTGSVYNEMKDFQTALKYYTMALETQKELLGEKHAATSITYSNIGSIHFAKREYETAMQFWLKALHIQEELFGWKHPETAISYYCVGLALREKGDYKNSLSNFEKALSIQRELLGEKHPYTVATQSKIAGVLFTQGNTERASELYGNVLAIRRETLGNEHLHTAISLMELAEVFASERKHTEAVSLLKECLPVLKEKLGSDNQQTKKCVKMLADLSRES